MTFNASKRFIKTPKLLAAINSLADEPTGLTVHVTWTRFNLGKFSIYIHEGLFRYLQDNGWLSKYMAVYVVDEFRTSGECFSEKQPAQVP